MAPVAVDLFRDFAPAPRRVLEIGCGLGTTAIWLARQGYVVAACDISRAAIARAEERARREGLPIEFFVADVLGERPQVQPPDVVFTRGLLHTFADAWGRRALVDAVADLLDEGRLWLDVSGSADQRGDPPAARLVGLPRLTATDIVEVVEPRFEIVAVREASYGTTRGLTDFRAFASAFRRRGAVERG